MKLQTKIQLFSSLFMLLVILLINTAIYFLFYKVSANSELEQLSGHTDTIVETLNANPELAENILLRAYVPTDGMIRVLDKHSEPIIEQTKKYEYTALAGSYATSESKKIVKNKDENIAVVTKPIIWEDGNIVTLQVSRHLVALEENMKVLFYVLGIASVLMLLPTVIAGKVLSNFLLQPIKTLIQTMKENTGGDKWKKIDLQNRSHDELYVMEKTFNDMIDRLEDNYRRQEVFVSDASHELKTPISIVKSYAQLLLRRGMERPELFYEAVEAIDSEADRMQKLVEQMLQLVKNEAVADLKTIDFSGLCQETIQKFRGAYHRDIVFHIDGDRFFVKGNGDQLQQIIYILIDNALKYSEKEVEVSLTNQERFTYLAVKDYGPGIPKEEQDRIFDRFYRIDKARSRDSGGTGLGLPIAKAIAEQHHGKLSVASEAGIGTKFVLQLPIVRKD